jgi:hypothetical protein
MGECRPGGWILNNSLITILDPEQFQLYVVQNAIPFYESNIFEIKAA